MDLPPRVISSDERPTNAAQRHKKRGAGSGESVHIFFICFHVHKYTRSITCTHGSITCTKYITLHDRKFSFRTSRSQGSDKKVLIVTLLPLLMRSYRLHAQKTRKGPPPVQKWPKIMQIKKIVQRNPLAPASPTFRSHTSIKPHASQTLHLKVHKNSRGRSRTSPQS